MVLIIEQIIIAAGIAAIERKDKFIAAECCAPDTFVACQAGTAATAASAPVEAYYVVAAVFSAGGIYNGSKYAGK